MHAWHASYWWRRWTLRLRPPATEDLASLLAIHAESCVPRSSRAASCTRMAAGISLTGLVSARLRC